MGSVEISTCDYVRFHGWTDGLSKENLQNGKLTSDSCQFWQLFSLPQGLVAMVS